MARVKRNCHTCARNWRAPASGYNYCLMLRGDGEYQGAMEWMEDNVVGTSSDMPHPSADGCPGWKPGAENTDRAQVAALGVSAKVQWLEIDEDGNRWPVIDTSTHPKPDPSYLNASTRGPGHTTAMRLRRAGLPVRARKVRR